MRRQRRTDSMRIDLSIDDAASPTENPFLMTASRGQTLDGFTGMLDLQRRGRRRRRRSDQVWSCHGG
jgi:hypothetical protein